MNKLSVIMFFLSLIMIGCTETRVLEAELKEEGGLYYYQGEPFTGVSFEMYNESELKSEVHYKDGKYHGTLKTYFRGGHLSIEGTYKDGKKDGVWLWYASFNEHPVSLHEIWENGELIESNEMLRIIR
jgi:antitoxin component YwqK of YwqJK toxin-antitoxin module